ncbi:PREDICTED: bidirectional sugar transporter SWEET7-like [Camelina sativa]|uniref:Bidirectional sugar transporter SWEET7-like n=1 Tax=Camelina sativa TaxID=90675 RepID=A0ABM1QQM0_CAMSA|nr:PREDICTED: bidirectional sugar transporter SWEET7-like [Camelina sativa]
MVWIVYGLPVVHPFGTPTLVTNAVGVTIMAMYLLVYIRYCDQPRQRRLIIAVMIVEVLFVVAFAILIFTLVDSRGFQRLVIGDVCCVYNIIMYVPPISVVMRVVKTKSVEHMSFSVAFAMFAYAIVCSVISFLPLDPIMFISFGICTLLGLVQVVVYAVYYPWTQMVIAARQRLSV